MKQKCTKDNVIIWIIVGITAILAFIIGTTLNISKKFILYLLAIVEIMIYAFFQFILSKKKSKHIKKEPVQVQKSPKISTNNDGNEKNAEATRLVLLEQARKKQEAIFRTDFIDFVHEKGITTADNAMKRMAINAIPLLKTKMQDQEIPIGACKMGGYPDLPSSIDYPVMTDSSGSQSAMQLMAQINFAEVTAYDTDNLLPKSGFLYIFWSGELPGWSEGTDVFKVIYYAGDSFWLKRTKPTVPYYAKYFDGPIEAVKWHVEFSKNEYPIEKLEDELGEIFECYSGRYDINSTKLLGYPVGSMNIAGVHGDLINLFQLDYHSGSLWNLYWYISKSDLQNKNFDHVVFDWDMD